MIYGHTVSSTSFGLLDFVWLIWQLSFRLSQSDILIHVKSNWIDNPTLKLEVLHMDILYECESACLYFYSFRNP